MCAAHALLTEKVSHRLIRTWLVICLSPRSLLHGGCGELRIDLDALRVHVIQYSKHTVIPGYICVFYKEDFLYFYKTTQVIDPFVF